ncbi:MAG: hypothetical protein WCR08_08080 [Gammaproteobacteria bacterium]
MKNIVDILDQENILDMFPKIQAYYSQQLGIHVAAQTINFSRDDDEPVESNIFFPHKILNLHKISQHNPTHSHQNGKVLDSDEIIMILSAHFSEQLSHQNPELKTLIDIRKHIEYLKSQHLNYHFIDDHPEASVIVRYMDGLYFSVVKQIKQSLYTTLNAPNYQANNTLLHPLVAILDELEKIMPHLSTPDLIDFHTSIESLETDPNIPEALPEDLKPKLQSMSSKLNSKIQKTLTFLVENSDPTLLTEQLPTLKSQVQIKRALQTTHPYQYLEFEHLLEQSIKESILVLLEKYESETSTSMTDLKKTQKMQLIAQLKALCNDTASSSSEIYQVIITHGDLLKSQSIGRYIYECICWLLQIKIPTERHSVTLFQAVAAPKITDGTSSVESKLKKD